MSQVVNARSPLSVVFLLHVALEIPVAIQGIWSPASLPFIQLNNTAVVILKLYASLVLATCVAALLCFSLAEFLPGKRAFAIALCLYHSVSSTVLYQSPRFIPHSFGPTMEGLKITPETMWATLHGIMSLLILVWWQGTLGYLKLAQNVGIVAKQK